MAKHAEVAAKVMEQLPCDPLMAERVEVAAQAIILRSTQELSVAAIRKLDVVEQSYVQSWVQFVHSVDQHLIRKMPT
jgi:hypothetical protein